MTLPEARVIDPSYLANGQIQSLVVSAWGTLTPTYEAGRVSSWLSPTYNGGNQRVTLRRDGSLLTAVSWSGFVTGTVSARFDTSFRTSGLVISNVTTEALSTVPSEVTFGYDDDDALATIGGTRLGSLTESLTRHPVTGLPSGTTIGNVGTGLLWNTFGQPQSQTATWPGGGSLGWTYEYDGLGRISARTETSGSTSDRYDYHYDASGRLDSVKLGGNYIEQYTYDIRGNRKSSTTVVQRYSYDSVGNRTAGAVLTDTVPSTSIVHDFQDKLATYGNVTYQYRANGQVSRRTVAGSASDVIVYDAAGNLYRVELGGGPVVIYTMDGLGRRVSRRVQTDATTTATVLDRRSWLYKDNLEPVAELDKDGNVSAVFVYGSMPHTPDLVIRGGTTYRVIADHLGSVRRLVNVSTGEVVQAFDYDSWGRIISAPLSDASEDLQPFRYAGGMYDRLTRLTRFGARDYDAAVGRWLAKDPLRFGGGDVNLYVYVGNSPINFTDPTGLINSVDASIAQSPELAMVLGGAVGAGTSIATDLINSGGNVDCIQWDDAVVSGLAGALSGGAGASIGGSVLRQALLNGALNSTTSGAATFINNRDLIDSNQTQRLVGLTLGSMAIGGLTAGILGGAGAKVQLLHADALRSVTGAGTFLASVSQTSRAVAVTARRAGAVQAAGIVAGQIQSLSGF